jgi:hypothetical protein
MACRRQRFGGDRHTRNHEHDVAVDCDRWRCNRAFRYQLTCIGGGAPYIHIADKITDGRFRIAGGLPGLEVSWQVTGVRQDAFAEANPIVVEPEKADEERGMYLHPNLFGFNETRRIGASFPTSA